MTLKYPIVPAIEHAKTQSKHGPAFPEGFCLGSVAQFMVGHPSGVDTAALGWSASKRKHPFAPGGNQTLDEFLRSVPRGFPLWFKGGTPTKSHPDGDGHVVISAVPFYCWTEDRLRTGFYDRVTVKSILTWNPVNPLRILGWSEDLCGFDIGYMPHSKDAHR